jgi:RHS repeat-associated protein
VVFLGQGKSDAVDESDLSGNITDEYVYFGGRRVAHSVVTSGSIYYYGEDFLGSSRVITTSNGTVCYEADFYPYGGERVITTTCAQNYKFEGKERDPETGNDRAWFRNYEQNLGRWMSPDPLGGDITNPQSLNRYAYVLNNPLSYTDPLGLILALLCTRGGGCYEVDTDDLIAAGFDVSVDENGNITAFSGPNNDVDLVDSQGNVLATLGAGTDFTLSTIVDQQSVAVTASVGGSNSSSSGDWGVLSAFIPGALAPGQIWHQATRVLTNTASNVIEKPGVPNPQVAPEALPETVWGKIARATSDFLVEAADLGGVLVDLLVIIDPRAIVPSAYGRGAGLNPSNNPM